MEGILGLQYVSGDPVITETYTILIRRGMPLGARFEAVALPGTRKRSRLLSSSVTSTVLR